MKRKYRKYTKEFKLDAVRQHVEKGFSIAEISRRLEVGANLISKWKAEYLADKAGALATQTWLVHALRERQLAKAKSRLIRQRSSGFVKP